MDILGSIGNIAGSIGGDVLSNSGSILSGLGSGVGSVLGGFGNIFHGVLGNNGNSNSNLEFYLLLGRAGFLLYEFFNSGGAQQLLNFTPEGRIARYL